MRGSYFRRLARQFHPAFSGNDMKQSEALSKLWEEGGFSYCLSGLIRATPRYHCILPTNSFKNIIARFFLQVPLQGLIEKLGWELYLFEGAWSVASDEGSFRWLLRTAFLFVFSYHLVIVRCLPLENLIIFRWRQRCFCLHAGHHLSQ